MVRARNDGEQGKRCDLAGQSGPKSFAVGFLNILSENVLQTSAKGGLSRRILRGGKFSQYAHS